MDREAWRAAVHGHQDMTLVNIQHNFRREAVMQYDAVIFMSEGRISEIAPYEKLSEKARSHIPFE